MFFALGVALAFTSVSVDVSAAEPTLTRLPQPGIAPEFRLAQNVTEALPPSDLSLGDGLDDYTSLDGFDPFESKGGDDWCCQVLPASIMYKAYLAGVKESRLAFYLINVDNDGWLLDGSVGGRFGVFRYGTSDLIRPQGFQIDVEGAAQVRLDIPEEVDVRGVDFRAGVPMAYSYGQHQTKFAYYHLSSHAGDEFLIKNPGFTRLNYARDVLLLGHSYYVTDDLRIYGEIGWAFWTDVGKEWELQFGLEYAPARPTGCYGAPFFALNTHLREEVNYSGNFVFQAGWAWRSEHDGSLLRTGLHYYNGKSPQFSFFDQFEQQIGFAIWYDF